MSSLDEYVAAATVALAWGSDAVELQHATGGVHTSGDVLIRDVLAWAARTGLLHLTPDGPPGIAELQQCAEELAWASGHPRFTHEEGWRQLLQSRELTTMAVFHARRNAPSAEAKANAERMGAMILQSMR
jgi:hypothetical protein